MSTPAPTDNDQSRRPTSDATGGGIAITGLVLAAGGWSGLVWVMINTLPTVANRWAFFALLQIATMGTALPLIHYLHGRFRRAGRGPARVEVLVREAIWVGLFVTACAWLMIPRLLSLLVAIVLAGAFITIEGLLRLRELTRWQPE